MTQEKKTGRRRRNLAAESPAPPNPEWTISEKKTYLLSRLEIFAAHSGMMKKFQAHPHIEMCRELEDFCIPNPFDTISKAQFLKTVPFLLDRETFLPLVDKFFTHELRNELYMCPRSTYKTHMQKVFIVYCLLLFKEVWGEHISTIYMRDAHRAAKGLLSEIKYDLEHEEGLQIFDCHMLVDESEEWSAGTINWSGKRDPSVTTSGVTMARTGTHPALIIMDDLVNDGNWNSPQKIQRSWNAIGQFDGTMGPGSVRIVVGTPFTKNDCYARIRKMNAESREAQKACLEADDMKGVKENRPLWREFIRSVHNPDGSDFFPALLTPEFLAEKKRVLEKRGEGKLYASWYLMSPVIEGEELFRPEYVQWGDFIYNAYPRPQLQRIENGETLPPFPVNIYMRVDPSITAKATSHKHGIVVMATDADFNKYVLYARGLRAVPSDVVTELSRVVSRFNPPICVIEAEMNNPEVTAGLQRHIDANKLNTRIEMPRVGATRIKKEIRIAGLEPWYRSRTVFWQRGQSCVDLKSEYDLWPDVADGHADVLDAHAGLTEQAEAYNGDPLASERRNYMRQLENWAAETTELEEFGDMAMTWIKQRRAPKTGVR